MNRQKLVTRLGWLGIIPFVMAIGMVIVRPELGLRAFSIYSLAILSFLAGSWWSSALIVLEAEESQRMAILLVSNVVVLVGLALVLSERLGGLLGLAVLYAGLIIGEQKLKVFAQQPKYYRTMRSTVSVMVVLLHLSCWMLVSARL